MVFEVHDPGIQVQQAGMNASGIWQRAAIAAHNAAAAFSLLCLVRNKPYKQFKAWIGTP